MLLFRDRKMFKYGGERTVDAFAEFAGDVADDPVGADVPRNALQRIFSETTKSLALLIIDSYDAADRWMAAGRKPLGGDWVSERRRVGGVGEIGGGV